ncbi:MAG TPA: hypothetical protein VJG30_01105 [Candidatus Nanoarchaeia archaeon]|nr:hypothetical protein [Candidatus Nanoarchaeia archaeon]
MKKNFQFFIALVGILAGLYAIFKLLPSYLISDFLSLTFGVLAIIWTTKALLSLSRNSSLRSYTGYFLTALVFIVSSSLVITTSKLTVLPEWTYTLRAVLFSLAYLAFVTASYKILKIGEEFGFGESAKAIKKALDEKMNNYKKK